MQYALKILLFIALLPMPMQGGIAEKIVEGTVRGVFGVTRTAAWSLVTVATGALTVGSFERAYNFDQYKHRIITGHLGEYGKALLDGSIFNSKKRENLPAVNDSYYYYQNGKPLLYGISAVSALLTYGAVKRTGAALKTIKNAVTGRF